MYIMNTLNTNNYFKNPQSQLKQKHFTFPPRTKLSKKIKVIFDNLKQQYQNNITITMNTSDSILYDTTIIDQTNQEQTRYHPSDTSSITNNHNNHNNNNNDFELDHHHMDDTPDSNPTETNPSIEEIESKRKLINFVLNLDFQRQPRYKRNGTTDEEIKMQKNRSVEYDRHTIVSTYYYLRAGDAFVIDSDS